MIAVTMELRKSGELQVRKVQWTSMTIEPGRTAGRIGICAAIIVGCQVLYMLSYGPIIFLDERNAFTGSVVQSLDSLYRPAARVAESRSFAGKVLRAYMRLWSKGRHWDEQRFDALKER